jgi:hypothetical protein
MDFTIEPGSSTVFMKQANGGLLYSYDPPSRRTRHVYSPGEDVSHISFCWNDPDGGIPPVADTTTMAARPTVGTRPMAARPTGGTTDGGTTDGGTTTGGTTTGGTTDGGTTTGGTTTGGTTGGTTTDGIPFDEEPEVLEEVVTRPTPPVAETPVVETPAAPAPVEVQGVTQTRTELPRTGASVELALIGIGMLILGAGLVLGTSPTALPSKD